MIGWVLFVERVDFVDKTLFVVGFVESVDEIVDIGRVVIWGGLLEDGKTAGLHYNITIT